MLLDCTLLVSLLVLRRSIALRSASGENGVKRTRFLLSNRHRRARRLFAAREWIVPQHPLKVRQNARLFFIREWWRRLDVAYRSRRYLNRSERSWLALL
jgi:hypothetical protein